LANLQRLDQLRQISLVPQLLRSWPSSDTAASLHSRYLWTGDAPDFTWRNDELLADLRPPQ